MATEEHLIIQKVEGEDRVRKLTSAIQANEAALAAQIATLRAQGTANVAADATVQKLTASIKAQADELAGVQGGLASTNRALGSGSQGLLTFARTLDDAKQFQVSFSAGLNAIGNNLTEISPLLGIASIGVGILASHWDQFKNLIKGSDLEGPINAWEQQFRKLGEAIGLVKTEAQDFVTAAGKASAETAKVIGTEQEERGRAFTAAVKAQGGGAEVEADVIRRYREANPLVSEAGQKHDIEQLQLELARARGGEAGAIGHVTPFLSPEFRQQFHEESPEFKERVKALEKENEEIRKATEERNKALEDANKDQLKQHEQWLKERSEATQKALQEEIGGAVLTRTAAGGVSPSDKFALTEQIRKRLLETGDYTETQAKEVSQAAYDRIAAEAGGKVEAGVLGGKTSREAAQALLDEAAEKRNRAEDEKVNRAKTELSRRVAAAKEAAPGLSDLIEQQIEATGQLGGNVPAAQAALVQMLQSRLGIGEDVAGKLVGDASIDAQKALLADALKEPQRRTSEIIASADFAKAIQSSVGADQDIPAKTLAKLTESVNLLRQLVRKPGADLAMQP